MPDQNDREDDDPGNTDDPEELFREGIEFAVRCGFLSRDELIEDTTYELTERFDLPDDDPDSQALVTRLVDRAWRAQLAEQAGWPEVTDCDRLDAAFAELERRRIIARQNFECCSNCGSAVIWDEADGWADDPRGYVFYNRQTTEGAALGGSLWFSYGSTDQEDATVTAIAREVVEVLREHDLDASWTGDRNSKIELLLDWRRRIAPLAADGGGAVGTPSSRP